MNTKIIMTLSALCLAVIGISLTFLPEEIADFAGLNSSKAIQLFFQLLGALYFAFAMLNYTAKGSLIGGIYNRPIALANFTHFFMGALALNKALFSNPGLPKIFWLVAATYGIFALLFALILFRHPLPANKV